MLKKILKVFAVLVALLIIAAIVLPVIFKDDIIQKVKEEANNNLNATVDFGDFGLSLFKNFPNFTLTMDSVSVTGRGEFDGIILARISTLEVSVDIMSVIGGMDPIKIKSFGLEEPYINVIVTSEGVANWDIAKPSEADASGASAGSQEDSGFNLNVKRYFIEGAHILYSDSAMGVFAELVNFNHSGKGDFTEDLFTLKTESSADAMTVSYGGVPYLNEVQVNIKIDLDMDMPNMKFTFSENEVQLNELFLGFDGWLAMPAESIDMDIKFHAKQTEFKNILSLVPAVFTRDFASVQTAGKLALKGFVKGTSNEETIPGFGLDLKIEDAMFKYPDLPKAAKNIQVVAKVENPGGDADNSVLDVSKFHLEIGGQPIDMKLHVSTPVSDPNIDCNIKSQLNLANLKDVIPTEEGESYTGSVTADVQMKGRMSAIENEHYDQFHAAGQLIILDMDYKDPELTYDMNIKKMYLNFSPQYVELSSFDCKLGKNDIRANGRIDNLLAWYFRNDALTGRFDMESNMMDMNIFMSDEEGTFGGGGSAGSNAGAEEDLTVMEVPANLDFTLSASIGQLIYDNLVMSDVTGGVIIRDRKLMLQNLQMNALDGSMRVSGTYHAIDPANPYIDFDVDIKTVDIKKAYDTFESIQQMAPIAENCTGKISTDLIFTCSLDGKMEPVMNSLSGKGKLTTHDVVVKNSGVLGKIADVIKMNQYKNLELDNVDISYEFKDGRIHVKPFDMRVGNGNAVVAGSNGFDESLSYVMKMDIPTSDLGSAGLSVVNGLVSKANVAGTNFSIGDRVNIDVSIGGTVRKPVIKPKFAGGSGSPKEIIEEQVEQAIEHVKEEVKQNVNEQIEKIMAEAERNAAKIRAEAKRVAEKVRKEGYSNATKLEREAKNPIAKIAAKKAANKLRKETDKKADGIVREGERKANAVVAAARKKADQLKK